MKTTLRALSFVVILAVLMPLAVSAELNLLPNPDFEKGADDKPASWSSDDPQAQWTSSAQEGTHAVLVHGNGTNSLIWHTQPLPLIPGGLYHLSFHAKKSHETTGGLIISGIDNINRDFTASDEWRPFGYIFSVANNMSQSQIRLGQWEINGTLSFDNASLRPVQATHKVYQGKSMLGEGETVINGIYRFNANYAWEGANYHRTLFVNHCGFNSYRWTFCNGSEVIYRHDLPYSQTHASLRISMNYHIAGTLNVEASRDGKKWLPVGNFDGNRKEGTNEIPSTLFPTTNLFIRLSTRDANANFQVDTYDYTASLDGQPADANGQTRFFEVLKSGQDVGVALNAIHDEVEYQASPLLSLTFTNLSNKDQKVAVILDVDGKQQHQIHKLVLSEPQNSTTNVVIPCTFETPGKHSITVNITNKFGTTVFSGQTDVNIPFLFDPRPGYFAGGNGDLQLWWCESAWKIGLDKQWPAPGKIKPITISAAKGEFEPFQLVLHPLKDGVVITDCTVSPFQDKKGNFASVNTTIDRVEYVHVTHPTDATCQPGWYPDILPPLELPLKPVTGKNSPLWITLKINRDTAAGHYTGQVSLNTSSGKFTVPVDLNVYNFEIPKEAHLRSALGLGVGDINRFHHLQKPGDQQAVYEKYLLNFVDHRISPYSFFNYSGIEIQFVGTGTNKHANINFDKFDKAAARWLDKERFNTFVLPLLGMGGGTFQSRSLGTLEGFTEGTPEHARLFKDYLSQIEAHLKQHGWMEKAFAYWFDEPDQKDFQFVSDGMKRIKAACPSLKRMLTKQPAPLLEGNVDIWCALTPEWTPARVSARRTAGQEVWWYICCGPTAPYVTEFIDHPGSELRLWPWQSWQYGVQGILIWATTYWTSDCAYPKELQDPWKDPMSYVSGYDFKPGYIAYWGNGDGRFMYPPHKTLGSKEPCLDGPVNSIRWENLRDGMEDYEYFWLLDQAITLAKSRGTHSSLLQDAQALLKVPADISADTTHFTTDPRLITAYRNRVARMIEKLSRD